jgi:hypothetical protein
MDVAGDEVDVGQQADCPMALIFMLTCEDRMDAGLGRQVRSGGCDSLDDQSWGSAHRQAAGRPEPLFRLHAGRQRTGFRGFASRSAPSQRVGVHISTSNSAGGERKVRAAPQTESLGIGEIVDRRCLPDPRFTSIYINVAEQPSRLQLDDRAL